MLNKGLASSELAEGPARQQSLTPGGHATAAPPLRVASPPVLDPRALAQLQRLDPRGISGFLERVLATFQNSAVRMTAELAEARLAGNDKTVRRVVHTFKSSSASIGATTLGTLCAAIEDAIVAGVPSAELAPELEAMQAALDMTLAAIGQRLGTAR